MQFSTATCAICGTAVEVPVPDASLQPAAPSDFDTRPGDPLRSSIAAWIQACPNCGYCAEDISRATEGAAEIVDSEGYRAYRDDAFLPPGARHFLCFSYLLERLHQHADAGWSALHAAWVCDDDSKAEAAARCRARALALWQKGKAAGQQFGDDLATEFALVTDVYRRLGAFEDAVVACSEGLDMEDIPPVLEQLLRRQMVLIQKRDSSAHSMSEL